MARYFIVWNGDRTEGFITDEEADAKSVVSGKPNRRLGYYSMTTAGRGFHEAYEGQKLSIEAVELHGVTA